MNRLKAKILRFLPEEKKFLNQIYSKFIDDHAYLWSEVENEDIPKLRYILMVIIKLFYEEHKNLHDVSKIDQQEFNKAVRDLIASPNALMQKAQSAQIKVIDRLGVERWFNAFREDIGRVNQIINKYEQKSGSIYPDILNLYEELVGIHKDLFEEYVIQRAKRIFGGDYNTARLVLKALIDVISQLTPNELPLFLQTIICDETFKYQQDLEKIQKDRHRTVNNFAFHINTAKLFESAKGVLIPQYILFKRKFDPNDTDSDDHWVRFAQGTIGDLSVYLAGHVFLDTDNIYLPNEVVRFRFESRFDPNNPYFSQNYKIGVVDTSLTKESGKHNIETRYFGGSDNRVMMRKSGKETPLIAVLNIPYIVWTRAQIQACEEEARRYKNTRAQNIDKVSSYGVPEDLATYIRIFVAERKFEHEILYALHNFMVQS
ncbi:hypothetical protein HYX00_04735 [Candidatus Woesearchaeota archaeon]|nr:hypothetical protein [Candidatus Woesearchaeota archaeon]